MFCNAEKEGPEEKFVPSESIQFDINLKIDGDIMLRCRHCNFKDDTR